MNVLSIGNSFSCDAQRYIHRIAEADGAALNTFNLYIGGCPLSTHYRNMLSDNREYVLYMNGQDTGFMVSLKEALLNRNWDIVTIQQASHESPFYDTYQPYLNRIAEWIRHCVPKTKLFIHQTWAYEQGCQRLNNELGYADQADMFRDVKQSYDKATEDIRAEGIIPSGEVFQALIAAGVEKVHRDTYHASLGMGRYALGLTWYAILSGMDISHNSFCHFDEPIDKEEIELVKRCVMQVCRQYHYAQKI